MITIDSILNIAIAAIKTNFPDGLYSGFLVSKHVEFNPLTNKSDQNIYKTDVEVIMDSLTQTELQASGILVSDVKLYVIGKSVNDISFYDSVEYKGTVYKVFKIVESIVGSKTAIWTIIGRK